MAEQNKEEQPRRTAAPMTGAEQNSTDRVRRPERPMTEDLENNEEIQKLRDQANNTANQTREDGVEEVQGRLAVPYVKVQKRGSVKWTDPETGELHKELTQSVLEENPEEDKEPSDGQKLHQEVLDGGDYLETNLKYQKADEPVGKSETSRPARAAEREQKVAQAGDKNAG